MNDQTSLGIPTSLIRIAVYMLAPFLVKLGVEHAQAQDYAMAIATAGAGLISTGVSLYFTIRAKKQLRDAPPPAPRPPTDPTT